MTNLMTIQIYCPIILEVRSFILNGFHGTKIKLLAELCPFWRLWERLSLPFPITLSPLHLKVLIQSRLLSSFSWVKVMYSRIQGFWYGHLREGVIILPTTQMKNYYDLGFVLSFMAFYLKHKYTFKCWHWSRAKPARLSQSHPPPQPCPLPLICNKVSAS